MDDTIETELRAHIARLEHRIAELEAVPEVSPPPTAGQEPAPSRRNLFRLAAVGVGGAAAGVVGMPSIAAAACGSPILASCSNDVGQGTTVLDGSNPTNLGVLWARNLSWGSSVFLATALEALAATSQDDTGIRGSSDRGNYGVHGVRAANQTSLGGTAGVFGEHKNTDTSGTGVIGKHHGAGWGMWATSVSGKGIHADGGTGTGAEGVTKGTTTNTYGLVGRLTDPNPAANTAAIYGETAKGVAIQGAGGAGRGGVFSGAAAQIRLNAGSKATHPIAGVRGDLYVDNTGRLWFCKVTGNPATWTQVV